MKSPSHYLNILKWKVYPYWRRLEIPSTRDELRIRMLKNVHKGRRAFIIGNGPSMRHEYFELLKGEICFGFNSIYRVFPMTEWRPDYLMVHDPVLAKNLRPDFMFDRRTRILAGESVRAILGDDPSITYYQIPYPTDAGEKPIFRTRMIRGIQAGSTIAFAGLQFAWYMGIREFYLLGIDLKYSFEESEKLGVHGRHQVIRGDFKGSYFHAGMEPGNNPSMVPDLDGMKLSMLATLEFMEANGGRIFNAAPGSPMEIFPRVSIHEVVPSR